VSLSLTILLRLIMLRSTRYVRNYLSLSPIPLAIILGPHVSKLSLLRSRNCRLGKTLWDPPVTFLSPHVTSSPTSPAVLATTRSAATARLSLIKAFDPTRLSLTAPHLVPLAVHLGRHLAAPEMLLYRIGALLSRHPRHLCSCIIPR
jgi:hypothetical protein